MPASLILSIAVSVAFGAEAPCPPFEEEITRQMREVLPAVLGAAAKPGCELAPRFGFQELKPELSPFWAQNQVGSDLAKSYLKDLSKSVPLKKVHVANVDGGYIGTSFAELSAAQPQNRSAAEDETHAIKTMNVLAGDGPFGVAYKAKILPADMFGPGGLPPSCCRSQSQRCESCEL